MHPAFNNPSATLLAEEWDDGQIHTRYAVKVPRYINQFQSQGLALLNQPKPQLYFHRPIRDYMNIAFQMDSSLTDLKTAPFHQSTHNLLRLAGEASLVKSRLH